MKYPDEVGSLPVEVLTGEVKVAAVGVLRASALGSCVAVAMLDVEAGIGGLAHVMLPGSSPGYRDAKGTKYAEDGIRELIHSMTAQGARLESLVACVLSAAATSSSVMTTRSARRISGRLPRFSQGWAFG